MPSAPKDAILAWHFHNGYLNHTSEKIEVGKIYTDEGVTMDPDKWGTYACRRAGDALFAQFGIPKKVFLSRVRVWGDVYEWAPGCIPVLIARHREVLDTKEVSKELRLFACWCARQALQFVTEPDTYAYCDAAILLAELCALGEVDENTVLAPWWRELNGIVSKRRIHFPASVDDQAFLAAESTLSDVSVRAAMNAFHGAVQVFKLTGLMTDENLDDELERRMSELFGEEPPK